MSLSGHHRAEIRQIVGHITFGNILLSSGERHISVTGFPRTANFGGTREDSVAAPKSDKISDLPCVPITVIVSKFTTTAVFVTTIHKSIRLRVNYGIICSVTTFILFLKQRKSCKHRSGAENNAPSTTCCCALKRNCEPDPTRTPYNCTKFHQRKYLLDDTKRLLP